MLQISNYYFFCLQGNWRHDITNRPVSREELMMVLSSLVGLRIRALYFTQSQRLSLGEVGLEETTTIGTGGPGNTVEHCSCPPQYTGDSCEVSFFDMFYVLFVHKIIHTVT